MSTTIQFAHLDGIAVGLADVQRGQPNLTCITCGDRLIVKDGRGSLSKGRSRRNAPRPKHFSHTSNSKCHGEGPAHYRLKMGIAESIRTALVTPPDRRNFRGEIFYLCPNEKYGVHCQFKAAPPSNLNPQMTIPFLQLGHHTFDLMRQLAEVRTEARLSGGKTRADIAGFNHQGKPIWIIEIVRSSLSGAATDNAESTGIPLFVIDISALPKGYEPPFPEELDNDLYITMAGNIVNGFYPTANTVHNVPCEREAFGMGPQDQQWAKEEAYLHVGKRNCTEQADCPGCELVLLHECNAGGDDVEVCPDTWYMFQNGITPKQMYTQPDHLAHSHLPDFPNRFNPNAKDPPAGRLATVIIHEASNLNSDR